jgi:RNA polymerase sigma-70 factor (ECF subfamily)
MINTNELDLLLKQCRKGDELAWESLVRQFQGRVCGIAWHYLGNLEEARDIAQEVFIRVYRNLGVNVDAQNLFPWIIRITRNACIDHARRKKARPPADDIAVEEVQNHPMSGQNPEDELAAKMRRQLIYRALQQLTGLNREIIVLKEIEGMQMEAIAELLGVPLGTIKSRSNRARIELAEKVLALSRAGMSPAPSRGVIP